MEIDEIIKMIKEKTNEEISLKIDDIISSGTTGGEILVKLGYFFNNELDEKYSFFVTNEIKLFEEYCKQFGI